MDIDRRTGRRYAERRMSIPAPRPHERSADQRLIMLNVPWSGFEAQLALRGEAPVPRIAYLDGAMELMSPGDASDARLPRRATCALKVLALALPGARAVLAAVEELLAPLIFAAELPAHEGRPG